MVINAGVRRGGSRRGFTLVEIACVLSLLALGLLSLAAAIGSGTTTTAASRETSLATHAARQAIERLQDPDWIAFEEIFAACNEIPDDDPASPDPAPGHLFEVEGLKRQGGTGWAQGEILLPTGGVDGTELREDVAGLDLNGDTHVDEANHAADYRLLPVTVRIRWTGVTGPRTLEVNTILSKR
jgi:prepilin-type N-terminal cleavage/methylation domain-containing protein